MLASQRNNMADNTNIKLKEYLYLITSFQQNEQHIEAIMNGGDSDGCSFSWRFVLGFVNVMCLYKAKLYLSLLKYFYLLVFFSLTLLRPNKLLDKYY